MDTIITPSLTVTLCEQVYADIPADWDAWLDIAGIVAAVKYIAGCSEAVRPCTVVVYRGSDNAEDWLRDLAEIPIHTQYGYVHAGFWEGMPDFQAGLLPHLEGRVVFTGHSLGAAHAVLAATDLTGVEMHLYGCPRPAFAEVCQGIRENGNGPFYSYRNGDDPVTEVPYLLGLYHHLVPPEAIAAPDGGVWVPDHAISQYVAAIRGSPRNT